ncbi:sporulation membrane protein YtaF [Longirhabdus pacifica]|uniref:sporulation membrane protein YtaF n=1 Tax=Longirhabdus pacifica TaxID=2305227 RepID=UPI001008C23B|nr:sporulation membrane protein YtaF [Longirhabdus pacifica]
MYITISLLMIAFAVSLDSLSVGITYGLRKLKIPFTSIFIISFCSGLIIYTSMLAGVWLEQWLSPQMTKYLGAGILIAIGTWAVFQIFMQKYHEDSASLPLQKEEGQEALLPSKKMILHIELKKLGIVIDILKTPQKADIDKSGIITAGEAYILGVALSLDALGAGIGAALLGFSPLWTAVLIAGSSGLFITLGLKIGLIFSQFLWMRKLSILSGMILITMGIVKLL